MQNSQLRAFQPESGDEPDEPPKQRTWRQWWWLVVKWELGIIVVDVVLYFALRWIFLQ